jgi:ankyrin repeat protein
MDVNRNRILTQREELGAKLYWEITCLNSWPYSVDIRKRIYRLIEKKADVNYYKNNGETVLINSVKLGELDLIEKILIAGADPNLIREGIVTTALYEAVTSGSSKMVDIAECLIKAKADVDLPGYDGRLPLLSTGDHTIFKILVNAGANLFLKNTDDMTVIEKANLDSSSLKLVLYKLTRLGKEEKQKVYDWLYLNKILQKEGKVYLPKDLRILLAKTIIRLTAPIIFRNKIIRAGGEESLTMQGYINRINMKNQEHIKLLENYLDISFLEKLVIEQFDQLIQSI